MKTKFRDKREASEIKLLQRIFEDGIAAHCGYEPGYSSLSISTDAEGRLVQGSTGRNRFEAILSHKTKMAKEGVISEFDIRLVFPTRREVELNDAAHEATVFEVAWALNSFFYEIDTLAEADQQSKGVMKDAYRKIFYWATKKTIEEVIRCDPLPDTVFSTRKGIYTDIPPSIELQLRHKALTSRCSATTDEVAVTKDTTTLQPTPSAAPLPSPQDNAAVSNQWLPQRRTRKRPKIFDRSGNKKTRLYANRRGEEDSAKPPLVLYDSD